MASMFGALQSASTGKERDYDCTPPTRVHEHAPATTSRSCAASYCMSARTSTYAMEFSHSAPISTKERQNLMAHGVTKVTEYFENGCLLKVGHTTTNYWGGP